MVFTTAPSVESYSSSSASGVEFGSSDSDEVCTIGMLVAVAGTSVGRGVAVARGGRGVAVGSLLPLSTLLVTVTEKFVPTFEAPWPSASTLWLPPVAVEGTFTVTEALPTSETTTPFFRVEVFELVTYHLISTTSPFSKPFSLMVKLVP